MDKKKRGILKRSHGSFNKQLSSVSSYNTSLPSPPYSEENYDSSSDESNESSVMASGTSNKSFDKKFSENYLQGTQNQEYLSKFNKVYPNLVKAVTGVSDETNTHTKISNGLNSHKSNQGRSRKGSSQTNVSKVNCNVCDNIVNGTISSLKKHLIFGPVICQDCNKFETNCNNFSSFEFDPKIRQQCPHHHLQFDCNPVDNFRTWVNRNMNEASEETFRNALKEYIHLLDPLRDFPPWSTAIKRCEMYIKARSKMPEVNDSSPSLAPKRPKKKEKDNLTEIIALPTNGHYLIVKEAVEHCPDCYEKIDIRDLKFNIEQCLIYTICRGCELHIYFVLDPPDGSEPKIKILKNKY